MYYFFHQLTKNTIKHIKKVSWTFIMLLMVLHSALSAGLMALAQEWHLLSSAQQWIYYYITTASSIGYGDLSPQSSFGRLAAALFLMPGAIGLFAAVLGKTTNLLINYWRKHQMGKGNFQHMNGHTIVLGWHGAKTKRVIDYLKKDIRTDDEGILILDASIVENPLPDEGVGFVKAEQLTDQQAFTRAHLTQAARIIVRGHQDSDTLAAAMAVVAQPIKGHVIAYFQDETIAHLLKTHHPEVECVVPTAEEMLVRAAQDPGSSAIIMDLMSLSTGPTQYSVSLPVNFKTTSFESFMHELKQHTNALAIGVQTQNTPLLNPPKDFLVQPGQILFYIADERLTESSLDRWTHHF